MVDGLRDVLACLDDVEAVVWKPYRHDGSGRPPRNPLGILKALIVKRVRNIPSDRELRELCDIEEHMTPLSSFSKFVFQTMHRS